MPFEIPSSYSPLPSGKVQNTLKRLHFWIKFFKQRGYKRTKASLGSYHYVCVNGHLTITLHIMSIKFTNFKVIGSSPLRKRQNM